MPNDVWSQIEFVGSQALAAFREHYSTYPDDYCQLLSTEPVVKFKVYSRWKPPRPQLLDLSQQYGLWIRATYEIEYGFEESGLYVVDHGVIIVDASYLDQSFQFNRPQD